MDRALKGSPRPPKPNTAPSPTPPPPLCRQQTKNQTNLCGRDGLGLPGKNAVKGEPRGPIAQIKPALPRDGEGVDKRGGAKVEKYHLGVVFGGRSVVLSFWGGVIVLFGRGRLGGVV